MGYIEETIEEIQPDGSIMLRRVIIPVEGATDNSAPSVRGVIILPLWGDNLTGSIET